MKICRLHSSIEPKVPVPEAVDLGLSVKWASFNLGASKPEEFGNYYTWGGTEPVDGSGWIKYVISNDFTDNKRQLKPDYDAATVNLGANWRLPTIEEIEELHNKCKMKWEKENGVAGVIVIGPNGNSIFLPTSDYRYYENGSLYKSSCGHYWSSTREYNDSGRAIFFNWKRNSWSTYGGFDHKFAFTVRPVLSE